MRTDLNATDVVVAFSSMAVTGQIHLGHESEGVRSVSSMMLGGQDTVVLHFGNGQAFRVAVTEET